MTCNVCETVLRELEHPENGTDWSDTMSRQGYQFYKCPQCGAIYGCRYQWDAGTGRDNRWHRFEAGEKVKRHY